MQWEAATAPAAAAGTRVVHLRTGIVLSPKGGALKKQLPLFKFGLGNKMGSGDQWQSWISIDDEIGAITHLLGSELSGPVNLTAPTPVTNADFAETLGDVLHRPTFLPIPKFGPEAAARRRTRRQPAVRGPEGAAASAAGRRLPTSSNPTSRRHCRRC